MTAPKVDQPVKLGRSFLALWLTVFLPSIWFFHPWSAEEPRWAAVISVILLPFLASLVAYSLCLFLFALVTDFRGQKRAFGIFGLVVIGILVAFTIVNWRSKPVPAYATGILSFLGFSLLRYLSQRFPNQSSDPTLSSGTPPAEQESRLP